MGIRHYLTILSTVLIFQFPFFSNTHASILFDEVTTQAGISHVGESWGIAWGDFNGDGLPDMWSGNHRLHPSLYVNNGDGTFTDILPGLFTGNQNADTHGVAWADFDNDGDQDLIEVTGGSDANNINHFNHLYVNESGTLIDRAILLGVDYPENRGRTPLWLDYNNDALLDLVTTGAPRNGVAPSSIFKQTNNGFIDATLETGFNCQKSSKLTLLSDISNSGIMDLLCQELVFPQKVYDISNPVFIDITATVPKVNFVEDTITADFNGDLLPDIFTSRFPPSQSNSALSNPFTLESRVNTSDVERGVSFHTSGNLTIDISVPHFTATLQGLTFILEQIHIGNLDWNPARFEGQGVTRAKFTLSSDDPNNWGLIQRKPGIESGLYIGYDQTVGEWTVLLTGDKFQQLWARMVSENSISNIRHIGYDPLISSIPPTLLLNTGSGFIDSTNIAGLANAVNCLSTVAGDFDNDMDLDIYMGCQFAPVNTPNILYENQGDGTFIAVPNAGGASGSVDGGTNNVAIADYDLDGFLDLYVVNGLGEPPLTDGPDQVFHNQGNNNHWIEIDLHGTTSNRDGIGSKVYLTTGGTTQLREQNGGIHNAAQNHKRLHFGLADNTLIDEITVKWPSGQQQILTNVNVDQVLNITEGISNFRPTITGTPQEKIDQGANYSFAPIASDLDASDILQFSITNKPAWAIFDTTTGTLTGTPSEADLGTTTNIVITVDDQQGLPNSTASLDPFNLTVSGIDNNVTSTTSSGNSGGGCTLKPIAKQDPLLPLFTLGCIVYLIFSQRINNKTTWKTLT